MSSSTEPFSTTPAPFHSLVPLFQTVQNFIIGRNAQIFKPNPSKVVLHRFLVNQACYNSALHIYHISKN